VPVAIEFREMSMRVVAAFCVVMLGVMTSPAVAQAPPPSFLALLPAEARLDPNSTDWMLADEMMGGGLRGVFPGPRNCFRSESEVDIELNGNGVFAALPDMMRQFEEEQLEQMRSGLRDETAQRGRPGGTGSLDVVKVGPVREEKLANGLIAFYEYVENCEGRVNATVAVLRGHARRGTTMLSFSMLMTTGLADARAAAVGILDRFSKFDTALAAKGK
jgi:hypothetical protein